MSAVTLRHAETDTEITACFPVMVLLRPHLIAQEFVSRVWRQHGAGYRLLAAWRDGVPVALAGYRIEETAVSSMSTI